MITNLHATRIARLRLGCATKILATKGKSNTDNWKNKVAICVFTDDFTDKADIKRVMNELERLGLIKVSHHEERSDELGIRQLRS